jgi:hypothetical protein
MYMKSRFLFLTAVVSVLLMACAPVRLTDKTPARVDWRPDETYTLTVEAEQTRASSSIDENTIEVKVITNTGEFAMNGNGFGEWTYEVEAPLECSLGYAFNVDYESDSYMDSPGPVREPSSGEHTLQINPTVGSGLICNNCPPRQVNLNLTIRAPHKVADYPFDRTLHSYPLILEFSFDEKDAVEGGECYTPEAKLYRLMYGLVMNPREEVSDTTGDFPHFDTPSDTSSPLPRIIGFPDPLERPEIWCPNQFFTQSIDLYGQRGPGRLQVKPGITIPKGTQTLRVCAVLFYEPKTTGPLSDSRQNSITQEKVAIDIPVHSPIGDGQYHRFRDGYIRRHMTQFGRGFSVSWLKQYEPSVDPVELLYHSRSFSHSGNQFANIYVPWLLREGLPWESTCPQRDCGDILDQSYCNVVDERRCIPRFADDNVPGLLHGGVENPLLRGGIAMAYFSKEYLLSGNSESLQRALELYKYVERSEWRHSQTNALTGFFLRSQLPHDEDRDNPFYASADEYAGLVLGLAYLNKALIEAGRTSELNNLKALVSRMAEQLSGNFYLIIPPNDPMLPPKVQTGWSGVYPFEWFFNRAFKAITDQNYPAPTISEWARVNNIIISSPRNVIAESVLNELVTNIQNRLSPELRAELSVKAMGAALWLGGLHASGEELSVAIAKGYNTITLNRNQVVPVPIPTSKFSYFNFAMLLHAYALGTAPGTSGGSGTLSAIDAAMTKVLRGTLRKQTLLDCEKVTFKFDEITAATGSLNYLSMFTPIFSLVVPGFVMTSVSFPVGWDTEDANLYAAALGLKDVFSTTVDKNLAKTIAEKVINSYTFDLPAGHLKAGAQSSRLPLNHNPEDRLGKKFVWEKGPNNRILGQVNKEGEAVTKDVLWQFYKKGVDIIKEGAGLGLMWPTVLMMEEMDGLNDRLGTGHGMEQRPIFELAKLLPACVADPLEIENEWNPGCYYPWPLRQPDIYDALCRNDYVENATKLTAGLYTGLTIDRSTLYSCSSGNEREEPFPATYHHSGQVTAAWTTDDVDYYTIDSEPNRRLIVKLKTSQAVGGYHLLVVDGIATLVQAGEATITVDPGTSHTVMVTGDVTNYSLRIAFQ